MNAYELAERGFNSERLKHLELWNLCIEMSRMLCNQADRIAELEETIGACYAVQKMQAEEVYKGNDRIAELEKLLEHSVGSDCREMRYIQEIENKDARIAELEKKGKPVAWMQMHYKDNITTKFSPVKVWEDDIPLYTTPQTKPLSNEEIIKIFNQIWKDGGNTNGVMHRFARAIEERHGIK